MSQIEPEGGAPSPALSEPLRLQAIVLAAGAGSRFGGGKLLAPWSGGRLIDGALRAAAAAPVESVVVVTGHDAGAVGAHVRALAADLPKPFHMVHAPEHAEGMAASLRTGIRALEAGTDGVFVFLGDMPDIPAAIPRRLAETLGQRAAAAPAFRSERGHPVLFRRRLFQELQSLRGDMGARALLDRLGDALIVLESDSRGVLFDVDRREDLAS